MSGFIDAYLSAEIPDMTPFMNSLLQKLEQFKSILSTE